MKLTKKKAKELSILKWQYLYDHPSKKNLAYMPEKLFNQIKDIHSNFGFCEYFIYQKTFNGGCESCPINQNGDRCTGKNALYFKWSHALTLKTRKKYAGLILQIIKDWKV